MDWVYAIAPIVACVGVAFALGWVERNVKNTTWRASLWLGSIFLLLVLVSGIAKSWNFVVLIGLAGLVGIGHIPVWAFYVAGICMIGFACWYFFNLLGSSIIELAQEIAATRERLALMENSLRDKLDDIASRLPETDSPETD